jgi:hypothetical protein
MQKIDPTVKKGITRRKLRTIAIYISLNIQRPRIRWLLANIQANGDFACWPIPMPLQFVAALVQSEKRKSRR